MEVMAGEEKVPKRHPLTCGDVELGGSCPLRWWLALGLNPLECGEKEGETAGREALARAHRSCPCAQPRLGWAQPRGCSRSVPSPKGLCKPISALLAPPRDKAQSRGSSVGLRAERGGISRQEPSRGVSVRALLDQV